MLPRLYRRRLWRRVLVALASVVLFAGVIGLALVLSRPPAPGGVRPSASPRAAGARYVVSEEAQAIRIREQVGGQEQEFEIRSTNQGLLIVTTKKR